MSYFKHFPKSLYDLEQDGDKQYIVDMHRSVRAIEGYLDEITEYAYHDIKDGDRPDVVSLKLYGTADYYWTFFIINKFLADGSGAWPMSQVEISDYLTRNYADDVYVTQPTINVDDEGVITDFQNNINADGPSDFTTFTIGEIVQNTDVNVSPSVPTATGTLKLINVDMNQLWIEPITGTFTATDIISGQTSTKTVRSAVKYAGADAPYYYYAPDSAGIADLNDNSHHTKRPTICPEFFGDTSDAEQLIATMPYMSNTVHLQALNDERSKIRIISPSIIDAFADEYFRRINE
jgi:hypothetical protein